MDIVYIECVASLQRWIWSKIVESKQQVLFIYLLKCAMFTEVWPPNDALDPVMCQSDTSVHLAI